MNNQVEKKYLAEILLKQLENCFDKNGKLVENYYSNLILEDMEKKDWRLFEQILSSNWD